MSAIPPNWLASVIQSQGAQDRAAEAKNRERAAEAERAGVTGFAEKLQNVIENEDRDGEVYSDAEGAGSEGRPHEETEETQPEQEGEDDTATSGGLDLEA
ncbi:MAG: hypothetical protein KKB50_13655 [Planctomycetes bacterium]|nr:hypothetical protein [Planctomycetota bacterium]